MKATVRVVKVKYFPVTSGNIAKFQNTIIIRREQSIFLLNLFRLKNSSNLSERILNPVSRLTKISYIKSRGINQENSASLKKFYSRISHHIFLISRFLIGKSPHPKHLLLTLKELAKSLSAFETPRVLADMKNYLQKTFVA